MTKIDNRPGSGGHNRGALATLEKGGRASSGVHLRQGHSPEGTVALTQEQALALGSLSPELREAVRAGSIKLHRVVVVDKKSAA